MTQCDIWLNMHDCFFAWWDRAVNKRYLILEFYDVKKKIVSSWSFLTDEKLDQQLTTFFWKYCCLNWFCEWLRQLKMTQSDSSQNEINEEVKCQLMILDDAIECWFCHSVQLRQTINSFTAQMMTDLNNDIDRKDSYQQSSDSSDSKNENENTMNELNREVSLNTRSAENCSWLTAWHIEFYSFSFLQDMSFMTLKS